MRNTWWRKLLVGTLGAGALVAAIAALSSMTLTNGKITAIADARGLEPAATTATGVTRDQATEAVRRMTAITKRVDRIQAKQMTWGEYWAGTGSTDKILELNPSMTVWVVAVSGEIKPQFAKGATFRWGEFVFNALTGEVVSTAANSNTAWSPYFDRLPDRSQ